MTTSKKNAVSPSTQITPDVVVQDSEIWILGEITYSLKSSEEGWLEKLRQLKKYDDDITGWWTETEKIDTHDIACLVQFSRMVLLSDVVSKERNDESSALKFTRKLAVIGFSRTTGAVREYMNLIKSWGELSDPKVSERLRKSVPVPLDRLVG